VTNLLAQLGDFVNVGVNAISVVDHNSFWVDGYFEERRACRCLVRICCARVPRWSPMRA
jgi:hypothetical protein